MKIKHIYRNYREVTDNDGQDYEEWLCSRCNKWIEVNSIYWGWGGLEYGRYCKACWKIEGEDFYG